MELLNEMTSDWEITEIAKEMDAVLEQYNALITYTQLNEGVLNNLDNLGDSLIKKVSEIQRRIEVISRARKIIKNLQAGGEFTKDEARQHRERMTSNRKALRAALKRTKNKMDEFMNLVKQEIGTEEGDDTDIDSPQDRNAIDDLKAYGTEMPA